jgi:hypothetical protein
MLNRLAPESYERLNDLPRPPRVAVLLICARALEDLERAAMKYTVSIEIALPRERVAELLADPGPDGAQVRGASQTSEARGPDQLLSVA